MMNYRTLIIAGMGSIGSSLVQLGEHVLDDFDRVVGIDLHPERSAGAPGPVSFIQGDIRDPVFLTETLHRVPSPAIFLNICNGADNVKIRRIVAMFDAAYIDSCCSALDTGGRPENLFSNLMPYTHTRVAGRRPQWLCWGINPGMVEIIARKLMMDFQEPDAFFDVEIYEHDRLEAKLNDSAVGVGWSPEDLIDEVMVSPSFQIMDGRPTEGTGKGAEKVLAVWQGRPVPSRLVGHEDIWNLGRIPEVKNARFIYALHPGAMKILEGDLDGARRRLKVPGRHVPVAGLEQVAVQVISKKSRRQKALLWAVDHAAVWEEHGVNAVQYQTGKCLLLAIKLLQRTRYGKLPVNCCASSLPITGPDWQHIEIAMEELGIHWENADALGLHSAPPALAPSTP